jgi:hypothetical protein
MVLGQQADRLIVLSYLHLKRCRDVLEEILRRSGKNRLLQNTWQNVGRI